jgi:hypothetical protein
MRSILLLAMLLAACSDQPAGQSLTPGTFAAEGRDQLCIAAEGGAMRAGLIAYGQDDVNCSAAGSLQRIGETWVLVPKGEGDCRIPLDIQGNAVRVGQPPASCSYYCGPGATMVGKTYQRADMGAKAVDLAGDPLC